MLTSCNERQRHWPYPQMRHQHLRRRYCAWYILPCFFVFLLFSAEARAQHTIDFTASTWTGCGFATISFTPDQTTGISSYSWSFGNGGTSAASNPSRVYNMPGAYSVKLTVTFSDGTSASATHTVNIYNNPNVQFTTTPNTGCAPLATVFTDKSDPGDGTISSINWDFGDGNGATGKTASYTYPVGGTFKATSIVTNSFGCTASTEQIVTVYPAPEVAFTSDNRGGCKAPTTVNFTNQTTITGSSPVATTYSWDFGDGGTSTDLNPAHTYTKTGTFDVTLTVTTANGCTQTLKMPAYIVIATMNADFKIKEAPCSKTPLTLQNTTIPAPTSATWTFPDGTTQNSVDAVMTFPTAGNYQIIMHATTVDGCDATVTKTITITDPPTAAVSLSPGTACTVPVNVQLNGNTTNATKWSWNFGDGTGSTMQNPMHTYKAEGNFPVVLTATSAAGCIAKANATMTVQGVGLTVTATPGQGCIPLDVTFKAAVVSADPVVSYNWTFGDGSTSTAASPTHTFTAQGNYVVTLIVTTSGGCTQTATTTVQAGTPVVVDFDVDKTNGCQTTIFNFTNKSTPPGTEWVWTFQENNGLPNGTSSVQNPSYQFLTDGTHDVTLTVVNNGCRQTLTKRAFVDVFPPSALFVVSNVDCANPYTRVFTDKSDFGTAATTNTWSWDFGDGQTSTQQSPTHVYAGEGTYNVTLTVGNGTCTSSISTTVKIVNAKPVISADVVNICRGNTVTFNMAPVSTANFKTFVWNFGDGTTATGSANAAITHTYTTPGTYNVTLSMTNIYNCVTVSDPIVVNVNGSVAAFNIATKQCKDSLVHFSDNSVTKTGNTIVSWTWDFGDGTPKVTMTTKPTDYTHTYQSIADYPVKLTVTDNTGCKDSVIHLVQIANIVANFSANSNIACLNKPFQFNNSSVTEPLTYKWHFGDGDSSTDKSPVHTYTVPGTYTVKLDIVGATGCEDHKEVTDFLRVPNPKASFSFPPVSADACPPVKVQFTNASTDYISSSWDFGDKSTSTEDNPLHNYIRPGNYAVTLTVYSEGGCASDPIPAQDIFISGPDGTFSVTPKSGCLPLTATMSAVSPTAVKYTWDFGDGHVTTTTSATSPNYTYQTAGTYLPLVILEDAKGCQVPALGADTVVVDKVTADFTVDVSQACDGGTAIFADESGGVSVDMGKPLTYAWDFGIPTRTDDVSTDENPKFDYATPDTYDVKLSITSFYGCTSEITKPITIEPKPAAEVLPIDPICAGKSVQLQGRDNKNLPDTKWIWLVNGQEYDQQVPPVITLNEPGIVPAQLTVTTASGICKSTDTKDIEVSPYPLLNPQPATAAICLGQSLNLAANTDPTGVQLIWTDYKLNDNHSPNPIATPEVDTNYHVVAVNATGCTTEGDIAVTVSQPFTVQTSDEDICAGLSVQLHANGASHYKWSPDSALTSTTAQNPLANPSVTTTYTVIGYGTDACFTDTATTTVTVHPLPVIEAGPDQTVPAGSTVQLMATASSNVTKIEWWPASWLDCVDCLQPIATPQSTTTYHMTATDEFGCKSVDDITIKLVCEAGISWLPNTFSPNNDGQNDIFYIRGKGVKLVKSFRIYNRWGQQVFERTNFSIEDPGYGWDGTFKGVPVAPDVFVYVAELVCITNEEFTLKGNVMLVR